jgi:hypothetical protein
MFIVDGFLWHVVSFSMLGFWKIGVTSDIHFILARFIVVTVGYDLTSGLTSWRSVLIVGLRSVRTYLKESVKALCSMSAECRSHSGH